MKLGEANQYLDWANLMTYDFHGAWNGYVGPHSALYPDSRDTETAALGTPVLNTDWAVRYYLGTLPPEKIVIGVPYYSRGWKNVNGGINNTGLYGTAPTTGGEPTAYTESGMILHQSSRPAQIQSGMC